VIQLLTYLSITNTPKAIALLEKYFKDAYETDESIVKYNFFIVAATIWDMLDEQDAETILLPNSVDINEIKQEIFRLATLFDKQNQTDVYTKRINHVQLEIRELQKTFQ